MFKRKVNSLDYDVRELIISHDNELFDLLKRLYELLRNRMNDEIKNTEVLLNHVDHINYLMEQFHESESLRLTENEINTAKKVALILKRKQSNQENIKSVLELFEYTAKAFNNFVSSSDEMKENDENCLDSVMNLIFYYYNNKCQQSHCSNAATQAYMDFKNFNIVPMCADHKKEQREA